MEKRDKIIWLSVIGLSAIVLGRYFYKQFMKLYYACYAFGGATIRKISLDQIDMTIIMKIMNKSDIDINIDKQFYEVYFDGVKVADVTRNDKITIQANSVSNFPIDIKFSPKKLFSAGAKSIYNIIRDRSKVVITTKGKLDVASGILAFKAIPFEYTMKLSEITDPVTTEPLPEEFKCPDKF